MPHAFREAKPLEMRKHALFLARILLIVLRNMWVGASARHFPTMIDISKESGLRPRPTCFAGLCGVSSKTMRQKAVFIGYSMRHLYDSF